MSNWNGYPPPPWYYFPPQMPPSSEKPSKKYFSKRAWKAKDLSLEQAVEVRDNLNKFIEEEKRKAKEKEKKPDQPKGFLGLSFSQETFIMMVLQGVILYFVMMK